MAIGFTVAPDSANLVFVGRDTVFVWSSFGVQGPTALVDTDDQAHEYAVQVIHHSVLRVYQDRILILTGSITTTPSYANQPDFYWGDGSGSAHSVSEWTYVMHNANSVPCGPPVSDATREPEPEGLSVADVALKLSSNPVRGPSHITLAVKRDLAASALLDIHDVAGRLMRRIQLGRLTRGDTVVHWNALDEQGRPASNGLYFLRLHAAGQTLASGRLMVLR